MRAGDDKASMCIPRGSSMQWTKPGVARRAYEAKDLSFVLRAVAPVSRCATVRCTVPALWSSCTKRMAGPMRFGVLTLLTLQAGGSGAEDGDDGRAWEAESRLCGS